MSFRLIKINGLLRRITERRADDGSVEVVTGFRDRYSNSSKSPGPGWRPVPGRARSWTKREALVEMRSLQDAEILEVTDWPVGAQAHGFSQEHYEQILVPRINAGVEAAGAIGKRQAPDIKVATVEVFIKEAGLAIPTAEEMAFLVESLWQRDHKPMKRATTSGSSIVTGGKPKKAGVPPVEVPPAVPPVEVPPAVPPVEVPPAVPPAVPPVEVPPAEVPPTEVPPTEVPPTEVPPTEVPPTEVPPDVSKT